MTTTKHTAEPWEIYPAPLGVYGIRSDVGGYILHINPRETGWGEDEANAARIVACVNACAGMEDPAAAIASAKRALERAIRCASPEWDVHEIADYKNALRAIGG